jgi:Ca-activated chloride channel homolog
VGDASLAPRGGGGRPGRPAGDARLLAARHQLADELVALRLVQDAPAGVRLRFLADLATRLAAMLTWLASEPTATEQIAWLTDLAGKLSACDTPGAPGGADLDALWDETIRVLSKFTRPQDGDLDGDDRNEFWKRPPQ